MASLDQTLLRLCKKRDKFDKLVPNVPESGMDESTLLVLGAMKDYYKEFPDVKVLDIPSFKTWVKNFRLKSLPDDKLLLVESVVDAMKADVPPELEQGMISRLLSMEMAVSAVTLVSQWHDGKELDLGVELTSLIENIHDRMDRKAKLPLVQATPEELMQMDQDNKGITFRLGALNRSFRPLRGGDFGIFAMRPDAGKTTGLASESSHWVPQLDDMWPGEERVGIWLNNEGPGSRIKQRWYQSVLGATIPEMVEMVKAGTLTKNIRDGLNGMGLDRMLFFDIHDFWSHEVEGILKSHKVGFVIFDMIDNIKWGGGMSNGGQRTDQILEEMYKQARTWCVKYDCFGVATSQISADGANLQYPSQHMLKDSKTGKQGACDFIIMGGKLDDPGMDGYRWYGAPKNKLHRPGGPKDPRSQVVFDAERSRVIDPED